MAIVLSHLLKGIAACLGFLLSALVFLVFFRAIISWVNPDPYNQLVRFLHSATDPFLRPIRKFMPNTGAVDLSPIVLLVAIIFLQNFLIGLLLDLAAGLR